MYELVGSSDTSTVYDPYSRRLKLSNSQLREFLKPSLLDAIPAHGASLCYLIQSHGS